jgi:hypothetical protein
MPIAPVISANALAMSPARSSERAPSTIFNALKHAIPSRTTSMSTSLSGRTNGAMATSPPPSSFQLRALPV